MLTYKEAFDKVTTAYINNKLNPWSNNSCFIGNLLDTCIWAYGRGRGMELRNDAEDKTLLESAVYVNLIPIINNKKTGKSAYVEYLEESAKWDYTQVEINKLEYYFLLIIHNRCLEQHPNMYPNGNTPPTSSYVIDAEGDEYHKRHLEGYEDNLFEAMTRTLEMLKQIHISRGENVEEIVLNKRILQTI